MCGTFIRWMLPWENVLKLERNSREFTDAENCQILTFLVVVSGGGGAESDNINQALKLRKVPKTDCTTMQYNVPFTLLQNEKS